MLYFSRAPGDPRRLGLFHVQQRQREQLSSAGPGASGRARAANDTGPLPAVRTGTCVGGRSASTGSLGQHLGLPDADREGLGGQVELDGFELERPFIDRTAVAFRA